MQMKMKPLVTSQRVLYLLLVNPSKKPLSKREKQIKVTAISFCLFCQIAYFVLSVTTFVKIVSTDLKAALYPMAQLLASGACLNIILFLIFLRHEFADIFARLSEIYKTDEDVDSFRYLARTNNKSERAWKIYVKCAFAIFVSLPLVSISTIFICWFIHGRFDAKHVFYISKLILPWNQETLVAYIGETVLTSIIGGTHVFSNGAVLMLFISLTWILQSFSKMYRRTANKLNEQDEHPNTDEILRSLIDFQNMSREFFMQLMPVFNPLIMIQLICNMLFLATSIFRLYLQHKHINLEAYLFGICALSAISVLFLFCYFGKLASESFTNMADCLYELDWHKLPIKPQKYIVLMIRNAQRPLYYRGFGMITLNLEAFCELIRCAYSYFMIFLSLTT